MTDLDSDATRLLELTREARTPSEDDKARVGRLLAGALVASAGSTAQAATGGAVSKSAGMAMGFKWAAAVALIVAGGVGYYALRSPNAPPPVAVTTPPRVEAPPVVEATPPAAEPGGNAAPSDDNDEPRTAMHRTAARSTQATLPAELDLLHQAQAAWRSGKAQSALLLLSEHKRTYPHSQLGPERDALTVLSLCALNRGVEARRIARRFLQSAPRSPLRTQVEESCGGS